MIRLLSIFQVWFKIFYLKMYYNLCHGTLELVEI
jgi:hypothetical protein